MCRAGRDRSVARCETWLWHKFTPGGIRVRSLASRASPRAPCFAVIACLCGECPFLLNLPMTRILAPLVLASTLFATGVHAQTLFGTSCAGASGVTPTLAVSGTVKSGQDWTLEVTAPGGIGFGYLLIGFSNTTASAFGGLPLPIDLGMFFADPLWSGCSLNVDPNYALQPYLFDPNTNGGLATFTFPGWDIGTVYMQAVNIDADFVTRIAGVSQGLAVRRTAPAGMVRIEPGTFEMGSNAAGGTPYFNNSNQQPVHTVTISSPFWMGQHEVTQAEYQAVMGSNPSFFVGASRPVETVSWNDALAYCVALTAAESLAGNVPTGYEYRLSTEAEWEYACRAGTTTEFNLGAELLCPDARFSGTFHPTLTLTSCGNPNGTVDVGSYAPNAWGLYDMHGNVLEWCLDSYATYSAAPVTDPFVTGIASRVLRGGNWGRNSNLCRSAVRDGGNPGGAVSSIGFRVVLAPVLVP
jgi:formylglycine-generating enzyme required for sulfatase activity